MRSAKKFLAALLLQTIVFNRDIRIDTEAVFENPRGIETTEPASSETPSITPAPDKPNDTVPKTSDEIQGKAWAERMLAAIGIAVAAIVLKRKYRKS